MGPTSSLPSPARCLELLGQWRGHECPTFGASSWTSRRALQAVSLVNSLYESRAPEVQQRGAQCAADVLEGLVNGLDIEDGTPIYVADLLGNRQPDCRASFFSL